MPKKLMSYLPSYYNDIDEFVEITGAEDIEIESLSAAIDDTFAQIHPETATWGLERWEKDLKILTLPSKPIEQRRSVVISKMRGSGKVSASMIKNVAESYDRGTVDVTVYPAEYRFTVKFIDTLGVPPNIDDLKAAIEEIKPAHLAVDYQLRYLTIAEVESMSVYENEHTTQDRYLGGGA